MVMYYFSTSRIFWKTIFLKKFTKVYVQNVYYLSSCNLVVVKIECSLYVRCYNHGSAVTCTPRGLLAGLSIWF